MVFEIRKDLYKREKYLRKIRGFYHESEIIKVLTGVRRCGKSSVMNLIAEELIENGVKKENILYFNLDKKPYDNIDSPAELDKLIVDNRGTSGLKYLFIDEIQNVKGFERVINSWREEGDFSIFITGSNSYLLSGELVTKLTGRYIEFNILPLTFDEYLGIKKFFGKQLSTDNMTELRNYILEGGFPYVAKLNSMNDKRIYVQNLINEIYEKDIKKRISDSPICISPCNMRNLWWSDNYDYDFRDVDVSNMVVNPIMAQTYIPKVIPPEEVWKAVYGYLSSQKEKPIVDMRNDIQKLESAGFDRKTSFRNV